MRAQIVSVLLLVAAHSTFGQEPKSRVTPTSSAVVSDSAADVLAFEREMEAAVVRGDVAFLDRACTRAIQWQ